MKIRFLLTALIFSFYFSANAQVNLKNGLVAHYTLDGHAVDSSSNHLDGIIFGASATTNRFGKANKAMSFNGSSNYIAVPHSSLLSLPNNKSISLWYKIPTGASIGSYAHFLYKYGITDYPNYSIALTQDPSFGTGRFKMDFVQGKGTTANMEVRSKEKYTDYYNQWIHIVATMNTNDGYGRIYFNGQISDSTYIGTSFTANSSTDSLQIGRGNKFGYGSSYVTSSLDDIRMYDRPLNLAEVIALYNETDIVYVSKSVNICQGDSTYAAKKYRKTQGTYYDTINGINGVDSIITTTLTVFARPIPDFMVNNATQCFATQNFQFFNFSTISSGTFTNLWTFGDGKQATSLNTSNTYSSDGNYYVKLVLTSNNGCKDSITKPISVYPNPGISFYANPAIQCLSGNAFFFNNTTSVSSGTFTSKWLFGDGNTSDSLLPVKNYSTTGNYQVKYIATTNNGCKDSATQMVTVWPSPVADFTINSATQCITGNQFILTNKSAISSGTLTYTWSFGDATNSSSLSPSKSFAVPGEYEISLTPYSEKGCPGKKTITVTVLDIPVPGFIVNDSTQCLTTNRFEFTNTSNNMYGKATYNWDFGDANSSANINPAKIYPNAGTYTVKLTAATNSVCKDSVHYTMTVFPKPVSQTITGWNVAQRGSDSTYVAMQHQGSSYLWNIFNGMLTNGQGGNFISVKWDADAVGIVKLVETDSNGCKTDTAYLPVALLNTSARGTKYIEDHVKIYPNPASDKVFVSLKDISDAEYIKITDLNGKDVYEILAPSDNIEINVSGFAKGVYLVGIKTPQGIYYSKISIE